MGPPYTIFAVSCLSLFQNKSEKIHIYSDTFHSNLKKTQMPNVEKQCQLFSKLPFIEVKSHNIKINHLKRTTLAFSTFKMPCNHPHAIYLGRKRFINLKGDLVLIKQSLPTPPCHQSLENHYLLTVSTKDLLILDISYK